MKEEFTQLKDNPNTLKLKIASLEMEKDMKIRRLELRVKMLEIENRRRDSYQETLHRLPVLTRRFSPVYTPRQSSLADQNVFSFPPPQLQVSILPPRPLWYYQFLPAPPGSSPAFTSHIYNLNTTLTDKKVDFNGSSRSYFSQIEDQEENLKQIEEEIWRKIGRNTTAFESQQRIEEQVSVTVLKNYFLIPFLD